MIPTVLDLRTNVMLLAQSFSHEPLTPQQSFVTICPYLARCITLVSQVTTRPDLDWQDFEGMSLQPLLKSSHLYLRNTQVHTYWQEIVAGGVRLLTSPTQGTATETRFGRSSHIRTNFLTSAPQKNGAVLTVQVECPLCTASLILLNSMRKYLWQQRSEYRMVRTSRQTPGTLLHEVSSTWAEDFRQRVSTQ